MYTLTLKYSLPVYSFRVFSDKKVQFYSKKKRSSAQRPYFSREACEGSYSPIIVDHNGRGPTNILKAPRMLMPRWRHYHMKLDLANKFTLVQKVGNDRP